MMKYFSDGVNTYGYDEETQKPLIDAAKKRLWQEVKDPNKALNVDEQISVYKFQVRKMLTDVAQNLGYDSTESAASYVNSTNKQWAAESKKFIKFRDEVWAAFFDAEKAVKAGKIEVNIFMNNVPTWEKE